MALCTRIIPLALLWTVQVRAAQLAAVSRSLALLNASTRAASGEAHAHAHASYADATSALAVLAGIAQPPSAGPPARHAATQGTSGMSSHAAAAALTSEPPQITPLEFLFISSPTLRKVVYVQLSNFHAVGSVGLPLIDSGLVEPCGLAFDAVNGGLYVADRGQQAIIRYSINVKADSSNPSQHIAEAGNGVYVLQGKDVEWVSVDVRGDLFYSDLTENNIGRIPLAAIRELALGLTNAEMLSVVSLKDIQADLQVANNAHLATPASFELLDTPRTVYVLYEGSVNPNVGTPGGVASDGRHLYWANTNGGLESGTVCYGDLAPHLTAPGADHYDAQALGNISDHGYGLVKTNLMVVFTASSGTNTGGVYGVYDTGAGGVQAISNSMMQPRGLAWDGDQTVYVADAGTGKVHSMPVGRLANSVPMTEVIELSGAFGLALVNSESPAFRHLVHSGSSWRQTGALPFLVLLALIPRIGRHD